MARWGLGRVGLVGIGGRGLGVIGRLGRVLLGRLLGRVGGLRRFVLRGWALCRVVLLGIAVRVRLVWLGRGRRGLLGGGLGIGL